MPCTTFVALCCTHPVSDNSTPNVCVDCDTIILHLVADRSTQSLRTLNALASTAIFVCYTCSFLVRCWWRVHAVDWVWPTKCFSCKIQQWTSAISVVVPLTKLYNHLFVNGRTHSEGSEIYNVKLCHSSWQSYPQSRLGFMPAVWCSHISRTHWNKKYQFICQE